MTSALTAVAVHVAAVGAQPADPQLPPSDYAPLMQTPGPAVTPSKPAPLDEIPAPRRLPPSSDMAPSVEIPPPSAFSQPMTGAAPTSNVPQGGRSGSFRDRWHYCMQSHLWGFPSQFARPPQGYFQYQHGQTEVNNGVATLMTLYQYDFIDGTNKLNLHGRDQLAKIASQLPKNFCPIVIERTPECPALAEARRAAVLNELAQGPFPVPAQRVVIGPSLGDDLRGIEAQLINQNFMIQTLTRGLSSHGGMMGGISGSVGGMGTSALGGGFGGVGVGGVGGTGGIGGLGGMGMGGMGMGGMGMGVGGGMGMGLGR